MPPGATTAPRLPGLSEYGSERQLPRSADSDTSWTVRCLTVVGKRDLFSALRCVFPDNWPRHWRGFFLAAQSAAPPATIPTRVRGWHRRPAVYCSTATAATARRRHWLGGMPPITAHNLSRMMINDAVLTRPWLDTPPTAHSGEPYRTWLAFRARLGWRQCAMTR